MSFTEMEVKNLVENFLGKQELRGYRYEFVKSSLNPKCPDEYSVVFDIYTSDNSLIDGPAVFIVNTNSKEVRIL